MTWQSVLKIRDVQPSDYATYECVAHNELGSQRQQIVLGRPSAPDPPLELKVVNVSHDSAMLSWRPGFDGGQEQVKEHNMFNEDFLFHSSSLPMAHIVYLLFVM